MCYVTRYVTSHCMLRHTACYVTLHVTSHCILHHCNVTLRVTSYCMLRHTAYVVRLYVTSACYVTVLFLQQFWQELLTESNHLKRIIILYHSRYLISVLVIRGQATRSATFGGTYKSYSVWFHGDRTLHSPRSF